MKPIIFCIVVFVSITSCQTKEVNQDIDIIETIPFSKKKFHKYNKGYLRNNPKKLDSFHSYIYTIVEPLDENKKLPKRIYALSFDRKRWKKSVDFFEKDLKRKNLSYLEIDNKIVFRDFYRSYAGKDYNKSDINKPRNKSDLVNYLKSKNAEYKILSIEKSEKADVVKANINGSFYEIIVDSTFCKSYLYYNEKDTINYNLYTNVIINFFR